MVLCHSANKPHALTQIPPTHPKPTPFFAQLTPTHATTDRLRGILPIHYGIESLGRGFRSGAAARAPLAVASVLTPGKLPASERCSRRHGCL
jgi:hypothetical protein